MRMNWHSLVSKTFRDMGHTLVTFSSGYPGTEVLNVDRVIGYPKSVTEFQNLLLSMTPLPWIAQHVALGEKLNQYEQRRQRSLYSFDKLPGVAEWDEPTFVFMHLLVPHWPFVFGPNGEKVTPRQNRFIAIRKGDSREYIKLYRGQVTFIAKKLLEAVDAILEKADKPPIIIIQGDHGTDALLDYYHPSTIGLIKRTAILNAFLLPGGGDAALYDSITPVNTFRVIFNHYFGMDYKILSDRNFFSHPATLANDSAVKRVEENTSVVQHLHSRLGDV